MSFSKILELVLTPAVFCLRILYVRYLRSVGVREINAETLRSDCEKKPCILLFWHSKNLFMAPYARHPKAKFLTAKNLKHDLLQRIAQIEESSKLSCPVPGLAPLQIRDALVQGFSTGIPADGPYGPRGKLKTWVLQIAKSTGTPVIPVQIHMARSFRLPWRWDKLEIAWPRSTVNITAAPPLTVDCEINEALVKKIELLLGPC